MDRANVPFDRPYWILGRVHLTRDRIQLWRSEINI